MSTLLDQLAGLRGLGDAYHDYRGELRVFGLQTRRGILAAMGSAVDDETALAAEITALEDAHWRSVLPSVATLRPEQRAVVLAIAGEALAQPLAWTVHCADGSTFEGSGTAAALVEIERRERDGQIETRRALTLPEALPIGRHRLSVRLGTGTRATTTLISAPARSFEPAVLAQGARLYGVAVQLYTVRSAGNWGMGDFADLSALVRHAAARGAAFIGLNPLHALFPSNPWHCSPYSPSSRHFLNVLYLSVTALPEYAASTTARGMVAKPAFRTELARLRATDSVDYAGVAQAKLPVLRVLHREFRAGADRHGRRGLAFEAFRAERGESLRLHSIFDALDAQQRALKADRWGWPVWPEAYRSPDASGIAAFEREHAEDIEFYAWLQWLADAQLAEAQQLAREAGMRIGLYGDYAVGVNPNGAETWSNQEVYRMGAGVGAPPDPLALLGQDWGVPPQDPVALRRQAYLPFSQLIAANMRHFGALRLDHVMALCRQWWVPRGLGANDGGYVHYPLDDLMSVLALESHAHACLVVGEDLGTVPDEMRRAMPQYAVYHYKVLLFEKEGDGAFRRPEAYLRRAIATVTTHDLPTLRGWWEARDLALRDRLGLNPDEATRNHGYDERLQDRVRMLAALDAQGLRPASPVSPDGKYSQELARAVHLYLGRSASALVVLQMEDLMGMRDPVNVPGTTEEYANWQRKLAFDLEALFADAFAAGLLEDVARARGLNAG